MFNRRHTPVAQNITNNHLAARIAIHSMTIKRLGIRKKDLVRSGNPKDSN
jgi:hypothetical protein